MLHILGETMKTKTQNRLFFLVAATGFSFAQALLTTSGHAATFNYTNTAATTTQWAAGTNWDSIPASASTTTLTFGNAAALAAGTNIIANNNFGGNFLLNKLNQTYAGPSSGANPLLTISGNPLEFVSDGGTTPTLAIGPTGTIRTSTIISNDLVLTNNLRISQASTSQAATLSGLISGPGNLNKGGTGNVTLSNPSSSFNGTLVIESGSFTVPSVGNSGANSPLGANGSITLGLTGNSGQLIFSGNSEITDKTFTLGGSTGGATITCFTTGQTLTITPDIVGGSNSSARTLTLSGRGNVALSGSIGAGSSTALALTKSGSGTATLTGTNGSFNGPVTVSQGTLAATSVGNTGFNSSLGTNGTINLGSIEKDFSNIL